MWSRLGGSGKKINGKVVLVHAMQTYRVSGGLAPLV